MRAGAVAIASPIGVEVVVTIRAGTTTMEPTGKGTEEAELLENGSARLGRPAPWLLEIVAAHTSTSSSTRCGLCKATLGGSKRSVHR